MRASIFACLIGLMALPACSTIAGVGKDVSALGRGVTHAADEVREEVFTPRDQSNYRQTRYQSSDEGAPTIIVREACDPHATQLRGGPDLPPCQTIDYRN